MKSIFAIFTLIWTMSAMAAQDRGGGSGVVCRDEGGNIATVQLLDYFEAREKLAVTLDLGPMSLDYKQKLHFIADRLKAIDPLFADRVAKGADSFESKVAFLHRSLIPDIHDRGDYLKPKNCTIAQMGAHVLNPLPFEKKYLVDVELWDKADMNTRAGLVLHEIVYEVARRLGQDISDHARYYTALISSREIVQVKADTYHKLLRKLCFVKEAGEESGDCKFPEKEDSYSEDDVADKLFSTYYNGLLYDMNKAEFEDAGYIYRGRIRRAGVIRTKVGSVKAPADVVVVAEPYLYGICRVPGTDTKGISANGYFWEFTKSPDHCIRFDDKGNAHFTTERELHPFGG